MNTQKKRKLHGSVLLTVVFVMSILIVFLFGTLALALAANNRAHVNYSSAQTSITARSVAESAVAALDKKVAGAKEYKAAVGALKSTSNPLTVKVGLSTPDPDENIRTMGKVDDVTISYAGKKKFFKDGKWEDRDLLKFTSNVTMSGVTSSASVYVLKQEKGDGGGGGKGGAGFVTTANAELTTQTSIWGGAYIGLPQKADAEKYVYVDTADGKNHAVFLNSSNGLISESPTLLKAKNSGAAIETPLYVCDSVELENWSYLVFSGTGEGVTVWGDLAFDNNSGGGQLTNVYTGTVPSSWQFNQIPYVYVDGTISGNPNLGIDGTPMNIFCGDIQIDNPNHMKIGGSIYCMDKGITSKIKAKNHTLLNAWIGNVVNKYNDQTITDKVAGDICTNGSLELEKVTVQGDVRVEGDLTVGSKVTVRGNVVVKGEIKNPENLKITSGGKVYCKGVNGDSIEIDNAIGTYYIYEPQEGFVGEGENQTVKWVDPAGNPLSNGYMFNNGDFNSGGYVENEQVYDAKQLKLYYTIPKSDSDNPDDIDYNLGFICTRDGSSVVSIEGEENKFYAHTYITRFENASDYDLEVNYGIKETDPTFTHLYGDEQDYNTYLTERGESLEHVYPEYAEKAVILGDNADTKVVKTVEEVLTKVSNPYDNRIGSTGGSMPNTMKELYTTLSSAGVYKTAGDFPDGKITESCMITGQLGKDTIIDPGSENMLLVLKDVSTQADSTIIVDDSKNGAVYIIIENDLTLKKTPLLTQSYYDLIYGTNKKIKYNSPAIEGESYSDVKDLADELGGVAKVKPCINIYGKLGSKIISSDGYKPISANILSPDIEVEIDSAGEAPFDKFYYNNIDIFNYTTSKEVFFGSMNAKNVNIPNSLNVIYVTDDKKIITNNTDDDDPFWYKILYYNEF